MLRVLSMRRAQYEAVYRIARAATSTILVAVGAGACGKLLCLTFPRDFYALSLGLDSKPKARERKIFKS